MNRIFRILICLCISIIGFKAVAIGGTFIAPSGVTTIVATSPKLSIRVQIRTYEVQIGDPSRKRPNVVRSSCTYTRNPCSIVDSVEIYVNDKAILIPRSVFCDLSDLNTAEIKIGRTNSILTLNGGDASESYFVKIEFDAERVKRRLLFSSIARDKPLEETSYRLVIIK